MNTTQTQKIIKSKIGLLQLAQELGNVSMACKTLGYSRDTFYRYKELYAQGGELALLEKSRSSPRIGNRVASEIEARVIQYAFEKPSHGQGRVSYQLRLEGILVSPGGVRSIWQRHNLENFKKRLKSLEEKSALEGVVLSEEQLRILERSREEKTAYGEIETQHPGYLLSQDTYYVGVIKGVGRIYQQTVVDTYSRVAFAKLYTTKTAITAAEVLNDKVVPWFEDNEVPILRILTDRGTEYNGDRCNHPYEVYLQILEIEHSRTKAYSPQTNGICERLHQTIQNEFYAIAFRKKIYVSLEELQNDLDEWIEEYNTLRVHTGKHCFGRTPLQTFKESKGLVESKLINTKPSDNEEA
jgi:transposase InsO family protein